MSTIEASEPKAVETANGDNVPNPEAEIVPTLVEEIMIDDSESKNEPFESELKYARVINLIKNARTKFIQNIEYYFLEGKRQRC
jgi:hypothetical protein